MRGESDSTDFDFTQSRSGSSYYIDNNSKPTTGGRAAFTLDLSELETTFTLGGSGMYGTYDPDSKLSYWVAGLDGYARVKTFELRAEHWRSQLAEAAALGIHTRPVVLGPWSFLLLSKGLERPLVCIAGLENDPARQGPAAYKAISRANHEVVLVVTKEALDALAKTAAGGAAIAAGVA